MYIWYIVICYITYIWLLGEVGVGGDLLIPNGKGGYTVFGDVIGPLGWASLLVKRKMTFQNIGLTASALPWVSFFLLLCMFFPVREQRDRSVNTRRWGSCVYRLLEDLDTGFSISGIGMHNKCQGVASCRCRSDVEFPEVTVLENPAGLPWSVEVWGWSVFPVDGSLHPWTPEFTSWHVLASSHWYRS